MSKIRVQAKTRAQSRLAQAEFWPGDVGMRSGELIFARWQRAVTPGQFAVFYQGSVCLGGGVVGG